MEISTRRCDSFGTTEILFPLVFCAGTPAAIMITPENKTAKYFFTMRTFLFLPRTTMRVAHFQFRTSLYFVTEFIRKIFLADFRAFFWSLRRIRHRVQFHDRPAVIFNFVHPRKNCGKVHAAAAQLDELIILRR